MRIHARATALVLGTLTLAACGPSTEGSGKVTTQHLALPNFTKVRSELSIDVTLKQSASTAFDVQVDLDDDLQSLVQASVEDDTLVLKASKPFLSRDGSQAQVTVVMPEEMGATAASTGAVNVNGFKDIRTQTLGVEGAGTLNYSGLFDNLVLETSGSGAANVVTGLMAGSASVVAAGSGNVSLSADLGKLTASSTGTGEVTLSGFAGQADLTAAGTGMLDASGFEAMSGSVTNSGAGLLSAQFNDGHVDVKLLGSGDIELKGTSTLNLLDTSGSGALLH